MSSVVINRKLVTNDKENLTRQDVPALQRFMFQFLSKANRAKLPDLKMGPYLAKKIIRKRKHVLENTNKKVTATANR